MCVLIAIKNLKFPPRLDYIALGAISLLGLVKNQTLDYLINNFI